MNKINDIIIIIPSYNPDEKLVELTEELIANGFSKLVVVNDGSVKESIPFFEAVSGHEECQVLTHKVNSGKGRALKTAFAHCQCMKECVGVITVDGDGQHLVKDILACAQVLRKNPENVILGVRDFNKPDVPFRSKFGNTMTRTVFRLLCGIRISDTQTGLRAIPLQRLAEFASWDGERYEYETNMLLMMKKKGIAWEEVKISTVYLDDNARSHFNPLKDSWKIYKTILMSKGK